MPFDQTPEGFLTLEAFLDDQFKLAQPDDIQEARKELARERIDQSGRQTLADLRLQKGMSQKDLATAIQGSQPRLSLWESGKERPSFEYINKLKEVLGVDYNQLIQAINNV